MKHLHPYWLAWFILVALLPATIGCALTTVNIFIRAYAVLHCLVAFFMLPCGTIDGTFPLFRPAHKLDPELKRLQVENQILIDALVDKNK